MLANWPKMVWVLAMLCCAAGAHGKSVPVLEEHWVGHRSTDAGGIEVEADGEWDGIDDNGFRIKWKIDFLDETQTWKYTYVLSGEKRDGALTLLSRGLSFFDLEITQGIPIEAFRGFEYWGWDKETGKKVAVEADAAPLGPEDLATPSDARPGTLYGLRFEMDGEGDKAGIFSADDIGKFKVTFETTQKPVWGSFYAKDGKGTWAHNTGFVATDDTTPKFGYDDPEFKYEDLLRYIPRPNGNQPVIIPTPAAAAPVLIALGATVLRRRRRDESEV